MRWIDAGPFSTVDLTRFRAVYAAYALLTLPSFSWVTEYPDSLYTPPSGAFSLLGGFPPHALLVGLEVLPALSLACLLVGRWVDSASVVASLCLLSGLGFTYSLSKIDHSILFSITPLFLAAAGWSGRRDPAPWVMRLFAWTIGLAVATAGFDKLLGGWLELGSHATYGYVVSYDTRGAGGPLGSWLAAMPASWIWEPLDSAAVILECGILLLALSWRSFSAGLMLLCVFHVAVMVMLGIVFAGNVVVYGAFLAWGRLPLPGLSRPGWWLVPVAAAGAWCAADQGWQVPGLDQGVVIAGAVTSVAVGARWFVSGVPWWDRRSAPSQAQETSPTP